MVMVIVIGYLFFSAFCTLVLISACVLSSRTQNTPKPSASATYSQHHNGVMVVNAPTR
jgi:hypothetical protein